MKKSRKKFAIIGVCVLLALGAGLFVLYARDTNLTRDEFLYDFDYMVRMMEDTFPYFGVAERRLGVDIRQLAAETRAIIENYPQSMHHVADALGMARSEMPTLDENVFWSILRHEFFGHFAPFANAQIVDPREYATLWNFYIFPALASGAPHYIHNAMAFSRPASENFYENLAALAQELAASQPDLFYFIFRSEPDVLPEEPTPVFTTEIIEEGRIAYISFPSFFVPNFRDHSSRIDRFYMSVQEYDHLIIDIRDNIGGRVDFWRMLIMHTIWADRDYMPAVPLYAFYRGGEAARALAEGHINTERRASRFAPQSDYLLDAGELLTQSQSGLPQLNADDARHLAYGMAFDAGLGELATNHFHFAQERMWIPRHIIPFEGQIWLLVNENNRAAAALFARQAKYTDFATLVGAPTGGGYTSTVMTHFNLPNTGILVSWDIDYLVDQYGRALEEFPTTPHHFNRQGMDALETALYLIGN